MQLTHDHHTPLSHHKEIILICDHIISPANMGGIFRLADVFGVSEIIFGGEQPDLSSSRLRKTARNTEKQVHFSYNENISKILDSLHSKGFSSIAIEITTTSKPIQQIPIKDKMILIVGSERHGISDIVLNKVHHIAHIKMFGVNSSMNVAQATAIALYEVTR